MQDIHFLYVKHKCNICRMFHNILAKLEECVLHVIWSKNVLLNHILFDTHIKLRASKVSYHCLTPISSYVLVRWATTVNLIQFLLVHRLGSMVGQSKCLQTKNMYAHMHFVHSFCNGNCTAAVVEYWHYPHCQTQHRKIFKTIHRVLREMGSLTQRAQNVNSHVVNNVMFWQQSNKTEVQADTLFPRWLT
jgi:hypothetical protein